jgi:hypothetical protein
MSEETDVLLHQMLFFLKSFLEDKYWRLSNRRFADSDASTQVFINLPHAAMY